MEERYIWMSMRGVTIKAADPVLEKRFWDIFPSRCLRFWPLFLRRSQAIGAFLERTLPVLVYTRMTGVGKFTTDIKLLSPRVLVEWRKQVWCISQEGRMWNVAERSLEVGGLELPRKPLWRVPFLSGESSGDVSLPQGVFPSLFSVEAIEDFLTGFGNESWFENIEEIVLDRRAGADLFKLRFVRGGQELMILLQKDKYRGRELDIALGLILENLRKEGGNHLIDATYEDKIIVRKLSLSAGEGSSK
ncbi:MAG: hypothetical protein LBS00_07515 [Synergistaceae bacterium]|nr:hypothetical protein [Synergistaceae bacterium]